MGDYARRGKTRPKVALVQGLRSSGAAGPHENSKARRARTRAAALRQAVREQT